MMAMVCCVFDFLKGIMRRLGAQSLVEIIVEDRINSKLTQDWILLSFKTKWNPSRLTQNVSTPFPENQLCSKSWHLLIQPIATGKCPSPALPMFMRIITSAFKSHFNIVLTRRKAQCYTLKSKETLEHKKERQKSKKPDGNFSEHLLWLFSSLLHRSQTTIHLMSPANKWIFLFPLLICTGNFQLSRLSRGNEKIKVDAFMPAISLSLA